MSAEWHCFKHSTDQLGLCLDCLKNEEIHQECNERIKHLEQAADRMAEALKKIEKYAFKASGDEFLMWVQEPLEAYQSLRNSGDSTLRAGQEKK